MAHKSIEKSFGTLNPRWAGRIEEKAGSILQSEGDIPQ